MPTEALRQVLYEAEAAFTDVNLTDFTASLTKARELLPCIGDTLTTSDIAAIHRSEALAAFINNDEARMRGSLRATWRADHVPELDPQLVPPGHPLRKAYTDATHEVDPDPVDIQPPPGYRITVDGIPSASTYASDAPSILQVFDGEGQPTLTLYHDLMDPPPYWPAWGLPGEPVRRTSPVRTGLLVGASGAAIGAGVLLGVNLALTAEYDDPDAPQTVERLGRIRQQANGAFGSAVGLGVASVGMLVIAVAYRW